MKKTDKGYAIDNTLGRHQLLKWINDTFLVDYKKIEDTCDGALACQIMDCLYPGIFKINFLGSIKMKNVCFNYKNDYDYEKNYKILRNAFNNHRINIVFI